MAEFNIYLGNGLIIVGLFFIVTSFIGIKRQDFDFMSKLHSSGIADSMGMPSCFIGIALISSSSVISVKSALLAVFILIISPIVTHSFVKAYYSAKNERIEK